MLHGGQICSVSMGYANTRTQNTQAYLAQMHPSGYWPPPENLALEISLHDGDLKGTRITGITQCTYTSETLSFQFIKTVLFVSREEKPIRKCYINVRRGRHKSHATVIISWEHCPEGWTKTWNVHLLHVLSVLSTHRGGWYSGCSFQRRLVSAVLIPEWNTFTISQIIAAWLY